VVDDCDEFLRDENDLTRITNQKRNLGLVVIRGTQVSLVSPNDGTEEISNPFVAEGDDE
jgi:U6 snRNA-associated Sm-like protein LSm7